jgi:hypothetical protein
MVIDPAGPINVRFGEVESQARSMAPQKRPSAWWL